MVRAASTLELDANNAEADATERFGSEEETSDVRDNKVEEG